MPRGVTGQRLAAFTPSLPLVDWGVVGGLLLGVAALYTAGKVLAVERLRAELEKDRARFGLVYEKRLEVISQLYSQLAAVEDSAQRLVQPMRFVGAESEEESADRFIAEYEELRVFFMRNRLFVPSDAADDTDKLIRRIASIGSDFLWMRRQEERGHNTKGIDWGVLWDEISEEVPKVRAELEKRFRELLDPDPPGSTPRTWTSWFRR